MYGVDFKTIIHYLRTEHRSSRVSRDGDVSRAALLCATDAGGSIMASMQVRSQLTSNPV